MRISHCFAAAPGGDRGDRHGAAEAAVPQSLSCGG